MEKVSIISVVVVTVVLVHLAINVNVVENNCELQLCAGRRLVACGGSEVRLIEEFQMTTNKQGGQE